MSKSFTLFPAMSDTAACRTCFPDMLDPLACIGKLLSDTDKAAEPATVRTRTTPAPDLYQKKTRESRALLHFGNA
jgi:hypothetical protein